MENISLYVRIRVKIKLAVVSQLCLIEAVSAVYMFILGEEKERQIWSLVSA